ncbi:MAG: alpha/beta hydrolase [Terrimicrobiaceae bacterium]
MRKLTLDLYLPGNAAGEAPPLLVYIHGGGWRSGDPSNIPWQLQKLIDEGYAVASISYRFTDESKFPAQLEDVRSALRWLLEHGAEHGIDPRRMVLIGGSAGGHLAMLAACTSTNLRDEIKGVVSYFGPADFLLRAKTQPEKTRRPDGSVFQLLGGSVEDNEPLAREASPAWQVGPSAPPLLIFHGTADTVVLPDQSERMAAAYREAGRPVTLHLKPEAGHRISDFNDPESISQLTEFLKQHLAPARAAAQSGWPPP